MHIFNKLLESAKVNKCYFCDLILKSKNEIGYLYTCNCNYTITKDKNYVTVVWIKEEITYQLIVENNNDMHFGIFKNFSSNYILFLTIPYNLFSLINEKIYTYRNMAIGSSPKYTDMDEFEKIETLEDVYKFANYLLKKEIFE